MTTLLAVPSENQKQFIHACNEHDIVAKLVEIDDFTYTYSVTFKEPHHLFYLGWGFGRDRWIECNKPIKQ